VSVWPRFARDARAARSLERSDGKSPAALLAPASILAGGAGGGKQWAVRANGKLGRDATLQPPAAACSQSQRKNTAWECSQVPSQKIQPGRATCRSRAMR